MGQWLVSRRGGGVPGDLAEARRWALVTLWRRRGWPASDVRRGDVVTVFDSRPGARRVLFRGRVDNLVTASYDTVDEVRGILCDRFPSATRTLPERAPEPGWLIACDFRNVEWIGEGPIGIRLTALRGGRSGWADLTGVPADTAALLGVRGSRWPPSA